MLDFNSANSFSICRAVLCGFVRFFFERLPFYFQLNYFSFNRVYFEGMLSNSILKRDAPHQSSLQPCPAETVGYIAVGEVAAAIMAESFIRTHGALIAFF